MSYPVHPLQDVGESIFQGLSVSRYREKGGVSELIVNVKDLDSIYINQELETIEFSSTANIDRYRLRENDVVIAIRGSLLKSAVVTKTSQGGIAGQNVAIFRPKDVKIVSPGYIAVLMRSVWIKQTFLMLQQRSSTTLPSIRVSEIRSIKVPIPEMDIQNEIVQAFLLLEQYKSLSLEAIRTRENLIETFLAELLER
ncbi:hypothetical protein C7293_13355 [filamentous cyanobacterium CCT1]|nr:hypothetical protein C7293_13355 [filamentous cyanobacterium CCT1]PSN80311.1 hypothetical protein C8B47_07125 [filamentous cyanobacterium CCP4]